MFSTFILVLTTYIPYEKNLHIDFIVVTFVLLLLLMKKTSTHAHTHTQKREKKEFKNSNSDLYRLTNHPRHQYVYHLMPYNCKFKNVLSVSLNKTFPSNTSIWLYHKYMVFFVYYYLFFIFYFLLLLLYFYFYFLLLLFILITFLFIYYHIYVNVGTLKWFWEWQALADWWALAIIC